MVTKMDLSAKDDFEDLAEELVKAARQARVYVQEDKVLEIADLLAQVREATNGATGPALALLEVTEAFLKTLSRADLGKTEIALRRFAALQPDGGAGLLGPLADGEVVSQDRLADFGGTAQELVELGALRAANSGGFDLRPSLRSLARELVEPAPFRMWRRVSNVRAAAGLARMRPREQAAFLAGEFGVTLNQAERYLKSSPLTPSANPLVVTPQRVDRPLQVVYRRTSFEGVDTEALGASDPTTLPSDDTGQSDVPGNLTAGVGAVVDGGQGTAWN